MAAFDEHASAYDSWFLDNQNLLASELKLVAHFLDKDSDCLLYTSPSPRDGLLSRMPSSA